MDRVISIESDAPPETDWLDLRPASPLDFTWDVVAQAMAAPRRAPHEFPAGPSATLI